MIEQIAIAMTGVTAIFLSQCESVDYRRFASIFGLIGQPFWFYSAYTAEQWGIFVLCLFYTFAWFKGFRLYWLAGEISR